MKGNKTMSTVDNCAKQTMEQLDAGWLDKIYFKWVLDRLPWEGALQPNAESEREKGACQDLGTGIADRGMGLPGGLTPEAKIHPVEL